MTGSNPVSPNLRRMLAALAVFCLALDRLEDRLEAQPLLPPATNDASAIIVAQPTQQPDAVTTPAIPTPTATQPTVAEHNDYLLSSARFHHNTREFAAAEKDYVKLLAADVSEPMRQTALFELGNVARSENDLTRASAIYAQYLQRWPGDVRTPDIYLRQGQVYREMDLPNLALAKFYSVMTTALALTNNQLPYYKSMVLQAQVEIAETHYYVGKFTDAVDYYSRLMTQNDPALDRAQIQFRLIRSLEAINQHQEAVRQAQDFLAHYPNSAEEPEVRYHLAQAYKGQNRNTEALQEVKIFLKEEREKTTNNPAIWSYWQQRVGNEIGNTLYREADYMEALQVYLALTQLDPAPAWQLPVRYQVGLTYEKLLQPRLAMEAYRSILTNAVPDLGTNLTPSLKSVMDMASWRLNFLEWNERAEPFVHQVATTSTNLNSNQP